MALIFYTNTKVLFAGSIFRALGNQAVTFVSPTPIVYTLGVTIYSGVAPTAAAVTASWATYNSAQPNYLSHYTNVAWTQVVTGSPGVGALINMSTAPTAVTPVNNGTASWAIIWAGQPTGPQLASATLPFPKFMVVSVSDAVGDGVIRFTSTAFTTGGGPIPMLDASMATNI
jgi:hypothetical protein